MKLKIYSVFALLSTLLLTKGPSFTISYTDDDPFVVNLTKPSLKVVQFADLHLTYGFDKLDKLTYKLINDIVKETTPDLVVFTGDQTLSITAPSRYKELTRFMESLNTPWTFIFGNHDNDFHSFDRVLGAVSRVDTKNLMFKVGPALNDGGYGNFNINYYYDGLPFYNLYFLDSKTEQKTFKPTGVSKYTHFSTDQVNWFRSKVNADKINNVKSTVYTHIPLVQYLNALEESEKPNVSGFQGEGVYPQNIDTGFFQTMVDSGVSQAMFVGHDHMNSFVYTHQGIKLGYGRISGYNAYGTIMRGARVVEIDNTKTLNTYIILEDLSYES